MNSIFLMIVNDPAFFISHRLAVAEGARNEGYNVHVATMDGDAVGLIQENGFIHHVLPLSRSGSNPFRELKCLFFIWLLLMRLKPHMLHLVTIKPVIYGGIAARFAPVKCVVSAVSGLGFVFISQGAKAFALRKLIYFFYWISLGKRDLRVIFQNSADRDLFVTSRLISAEKAELIRGSGVDLDHYLFRAEPSVTSPVICLAARLLRDKGVLEFVEAASILHTRGVKARFQLIGDIDPGNPATVTESEISEWRSRGLVDVLGYRNDIATLLANAHIVTLPSYREGLPKILVEAAACGRAIVTTDVPGCRDAIEPNISGLLVPVRNAAALADAIQLLIENPALRQTMGIAGRALAEREFSLKNIVRQHLDIYKSLEIKAGYEQ